MPSEKELIMYQKSTVFDLLRIIKEGASDTYTKAELENILTAYVAGLEQK